MNMNDSYVGIRRFCLSGDPHLQTFGICRRFFQQPRDFCSPVCEDLDLYKNLFAYVYPVLLLMCLVGNSFNLGVYSEVHLRTSSTVRLLFAKAVANCGFLLSLAPGLVKVLHPGDGSIEQFYWHSNPSVLFLANTFGGCSTWLTVGLTIDTYMCIVVPSRFKQLCTMRFANIVVMLSFTLSVVLQVFYPLTRTAQLVDCGGNSSQYQILRRFTPDMPSLVLYEKFYHWTNTICVIILPFLLMALLSVLILRSIKCTEGGRFTNLKRCILRITFLTTLTHLLLECPQSVMYFAAAFRGSSDIQSDLALADCNLAVITNFLSMTNAAVPFLLYTSSSRKFRRVLLLRIERFLCCSKKCRAKYNCVPLQQSGFEDSVDQRNGFHLVKDTAEIQGLVTMSTVRRPFDITSKVQRV